METFSSLAYPVAHLIEPIGGGVVMMFQNILIRRSLPQSSSFLKTITGYYASTTNSVCEDPHYTKLLLKQNYEKDFGKKFYLIKV